jgi:hypothetical protein
MLTSYLILSLTFASDLKGLESPRFAERQAAQARLEAAGYWGALACQRTFRSAEARARAARVRERYAAYDERLLPEAYKFAWTRPRWLGQLIYEAAWWPAGVGTGWGDQERAATARLLRRLIITHGVPREGTDWLIFWGDSSEFPIHWPEY